MHNLHKRNEPNQIPSSSLLNPASIDTLQSRPASAASSVFDTTPKGVHVVTNQSTDDTPHGRVGESNDRDGSNSSFIVVSGGTGCNSICSAFGEAVCYVLPVSDNGGSSSEVIVVAFLHLPNLMRTFLDHSGIRPVVCDKYRLIIGPNFLLLDNRRRSFYRLVPPKLFSVNATDAATGSVR
jgi:hypothetical protein